MTKVNTTKIKVAIVGATGYTGVELIRLLSLHPHTDIQYLVSRTEAGRRVDEIFPSLRNVACDLVFDNLDAQKLLACDVVFFATPHGVAMQHARTLIAKGVKVIDLASDFRLQNLTEFEKWYQLVHVCPDLLQQAVYGLPEINREKIKTAMIIGNPGCYPTTAILGLAPIIHQQNLMNQSVIDPYIVIDAKSGVSGAGRQAKLNLMFSEISDSFSAYGVAGHRHLPEIEQGIDTLILKPGQNQPQRHQIRFVPHLVPMIRGMFSTIHLRLTDVGQTLDLQRLYTDFYRHESFVDVLPSGQYPNTGSVRGSNRLRIAVQTFANSPVATILVVQDNLVKGASGQAVQNMNLMFGLDETAGLTLAPISP
ncbi:N-acetyl-gamma-glutamyl-phosphate reductase [Moraxella macacae 0408225]|uniref:N-acetyl-gamma-glutamyl-phosphate reductase n=1 Tax=Moraxella macacae 0408225 TaxID=1230338 RepID=L2F6J4_9GAMM|nr:N-acetyl-gamma-glutamyl-phosphate reductase [Moraxella macacae]ELA08530.1 N-acetyl-gamma-glutamyl-phosphate reductase [Moraxella macacae 0408225]